MEKSFSLGYRRKQRPCVGVGGTVEDVLRRAYLHDLACVHDAYSVCHVGDDAQIVGDEDDGEVSLPLHFIYKLKYFALYSDIEGRCRLVAYQNLGVAGESYGDDYSLAHTARKLEGILLVSQLRIGYADGRHQLYGLCLGLFLFKTAAQNESFGYLLAYFHYGVEGREGVLENKGDLLAADLVEILFLVFCHVLALVDYLARVDVAVFGQYSQNRLGGHRLSRARLADYDEGLAFIKLEIYVSDRLNLSREGVEGDAQVLYL